MKKNTRQVWDAVWADPHLQANHQLILATEEQTIRWHKIVDVVRQAYGSFKNLTVLEIGSGTGTYAALMAKQGARVTLLDYSPEALAKAKVFFESNNLKAQYIQADACNLPEKIKQKKFDISISIGLTEHFKGKKRLAINKVHLDVLNKGGLAIISVPNAHNPPYMIFKTVSTILGKWKFGEEYPYTRDELMKIAKTLNTEVIALFGDSLHTSIKFLLPANFLRRWCGVSFPRNFSEIRQEVSSPWDDYLSYSLVLVLRKS